MPSTNETGFTPNELSVLNVIAITLRTKVGRDMAVTIKQMCSGILRNYNVAVTEPRMRKIVTHIRNNNMVSGLMVAADGYYVTYDFAEVKACIDKLAKQEAELSTLKQQMCKYLQALAAHRPDDRLSFTDKETQALYSWIKERLQPAQLPVYSAAFVAGLTHAIHCNFFYHLIAKQDPAFIQALLSYFRSIGDETRADLIRGQVARVKQDPAILQVFPYAVNLSPAA